jgi:hypothetical protein
MFTASIIIRAMTMEAVSISETSIDVDGPDDRDGKLF